MITKNARDTEGGSLFFALRVLLTIFLNRCEICDGTRIVLCTIVSPNRLLFMVKQLMHIDFVIFCKYYCCLFSYLWVTCTYSVCVLCAASARTVFHNEQKKKKKKYQTSVSLQNSDIQDPTKYYSPVGGGHIWYCLYPKRVGIYLFLSCSSYISVFVFDTNTFSAGETQRRGCKSHHQDQRGSSRRWGPKLLEKLWDELTLGIEYEKTHNPSIHKIVEILSGNRFVYVKKNG